jgi:hypothetical protein
MSEIENKIKRERENLIERMREREGQKNLKPNMVIADSRI